MTPPLIYTEKSLSEYMHWQLQNLASILGLSVGAADAGSYAEAVNAALLAYGVSAISQASDIAKIRALARVEVWRMACNSLAALYDFSADGGSYQRGQMLAQAKKNLETALTDALGYDPAYRVGPG